MDRTVKLIVSDPNVMMGKPVILGTRITVELILEKLSAGETIEQILDAHPRLTREAIQAALAFAAEALRADMEAIRIQQVIAEDGRVSITGLPYKKGQFVEIILLPQPLKTVSRSRLTVRQLRQSGLIGLWKDRDNIGDSAAYVRQLREQAQPLQERNARYVVDTEGQPIAVLLTIEEYEHYLDLLDDEMDSQDGELAARLTQAATQPIGGEHLAFRDYLRQRKAPHANQVPS